MPTPSAPIHSPWSARPADHGASKASSPDPQKTPKPKPAAINAPAPSTLCGFLELGDDPADRFLRVTEQHPRLGIEIQLVVDAGEARLHRALDDDDVLRLVHVEDRHAVDRARRVLPGRGG